MVRTAGTVRNVLNSLPKKKKKVILTSCSDKVEQPLSRSSQRNVCSTKTSSGDLTDKDPACRSPSKLESSEGLLVRHYSRWFEIHLRSPEVNAGNGNISKRCHLSNEFSIILSSPQRLLIQVTHRLALLRWLHAAIDADNVQNSSLSSSSPNQTAPTTQRVGYKREKNGTANKLDNAIDASGEERWVGLVHAEVIENLRSVIVLESVIVSTTV